MRNTELIQYVTANVAWMGVGFMIGAAVGSLKRRAHVERR